jgi:tripartite-type tricarboxylate transporter receptor subunit TctC
MGKSSFSRRDFLKASGLSAGALALGSLSHVALSFAAKDVYPAEKITFILPHAAGGGFDIIARGISPYITKYLREASPGTKGGDILVRNEPAAAGLKAYSMLFNARTDGYTIGSLDSGAITDNIVEKPQFDYSKLTFLLLAVSSIKMIVTSKDGFKSWKDVAEATKKGPVKLGVGQFGRGNHVAGIIMIEGVKTTGFKIINYPGTAQCMAGLIRGDVQVAMVSEESVTGLIAAKEIKVLLTGGESSDYPGSVSTRDLGHPELGEEVSTHRFIVGPPNLAAEPKNMLLTAIKKATTDSEFTAWAKKADIPLRNIYGDDAQKMFLSFAKFYEDLGPTFKKYLK